MQAAQLPEPAAVPVQRPASPALAPVLRTISGETPHYRARFEIAAADGADAAEAVKGIVMGWLHAKGLDVPEGAADIAVPAGWTGADEPDAARAVRFLSLSGAQGAAWAVEADELDGEFSRRRWHTRIGLAPAGDGGCILNVQVSHYAVNGFFGYQRSPLPSVPRVVRDILADGGLDGFINVLMQGLGRGIDARSGDVAGIGDVLWLRSRAESERQGERIERLRSRAKAAADIDGLRAEIARLRSDAEAWEEIATDQERSYSDATAKVDELTRTVQRLEGEKRALERKAAQCAAPSEDDGAARVAECLQAIPRDLTDLLKLARSIWPNRIVVLPEAMDSAKSYDGNLAEEWDIVRGAATALYGLLFEDDGCEGQVADEFQRRTGYELTFSESSATRARVDLMKMRERSYCGRTVDISAHIKGRSQKNSFRLHFYIDRENELIVIGHAGCHMKTAGSQRRGFK